MSRRVMLNNVEHGDLRVITTRSARYGDAVMSAMTFPFEFRSVQTAYPILLQRKESGGYVPVALFGFERGENLFLDAGGWNAAYIPAMIRREPFMIGFSQGAEQSTRVLSLDLDHPRVSREEGEALFQPLGGRTPFLERAADLLEQIYEGLAQNERFVAALEAHGLIESVTLGIRLRDGSNNHLVGFHAIDEDRLRELDDAALGSLNREGHLMPIFMMLASLPNVQRLAELKNAVTGKT